MRFAGNRNYGQSVEELGHGKLGIFRGKNIGDGQHNSVAVLARQNMAYLGSRPWTALRERCFHIGCRVAVYVHLIIVIEVSHDAMF